MNPTPQVSLNEQAHSNFPPADYNFQTTVNSRTTSSAVLPEKKLRAFHKLSAEFFDVETSRDYVAELLLFALITGVSAWPIISTIDAVTRLVRNY